MATRPEDVEAARGRLARKARRLARSASKLVGGQSAEVHREAEDLRTILASHAALTEAAQAVVDRWDSPKWKDAEHTGVLIGRLRALLSGKASAC